MENFAQVMTMDQLPFGGGARSESRKKRNMLGVRQVEYQVEDLSLLEHRSSNTLEGISCASNHFLKSSMRRESFDEECSIIQ